MMAALLLIAGMAGAQSPPDMTPPLTCSGQFSMGGPSSCKDTTTWRAYANQDCVARGYLFASAFIYVDACGPNQSRYVKYECCA